MFYPITTMFLREIFVYPQSLLHFSWPARLTGSRSRPFPVAAQQLHSTFVKNSLQGLTCQPGRSSWNQQRLLRTTDIHLCRLLEYRKGPDTKRKVHLCEIQKLPLSCKIKSQLAVCQHGRRRNARSGRCGRIRTGHYMLFVDQIRQFLKNLNPAIGWPGPKLSFWKRIPRLKYLRGYTWALP